MQAPATDYVSAATEAVLAIHRAEVPGDVLVFLTSKSEAHECVSALQQGSNTMAMRHVQDRLKPVALFAGASNRRDDSSHCALAFAVRQRLCAAQACPRATRRRC